MLLSRLVFGCHSIYICSPEQVCSKDVNAEQLAVPNKCDVVMSASVVKHLIDNQGKTTKFWEIPVTVREYQIVGKHRLSWYFLFSLVLEITLYLSFIMYSQYCLLIFKVCKTWGGSSASLIWLAIIVFSCCTCQIETAC